MDAKIISSAVSSTQVPAQQRAQNPALLETQKGSRQSAPNDVSISENTTSPKFAESAKVQTEKEIDELVDRLNTQSLTSSHTLRFSIDEKLGKAIISVVDRETDEVIRQIPPETALQIAEAFEEVTSGQLLTELA